VRRSVAANGTTSQVPPHHSQILTFGPSVVVALMLADSLLLGLIGPAGPFGSFMVVPPIPDPGWDYARGQRRSWRARFDPDRRTFR